MPNEETTKIILEFPASNVKIELGTTITFDNISGSLNSDRVTVDGDTLTEKLSAMDGEIDEKADSDDVYDKTYMDGIFEQIDNAFTGVNNSLNTKMNKSNPTGTGNVSVGNNLNNWGSNSQAFGSGNTVVGQNSLVGGNNNSAICNNTTVLGRGNNYYNDDALVFGKYCSPDPNKLEVVGKGTSENNRSNARTLDWNGNETLAGNLTFNGNKSLTSEISRLDGKIDNLPAPMIFKGTLGVGGTIQTLPTASASNEGYTYKVITDGTYAGQTAKVGDVFTSNGSEWVYIPSGDEDNDTWRAIKVNGTEELGSGISSGSVDFVGSENIDVEFDSDGNKIGIKTKNIYTKAEVNDIVAEAIYDVLPSEVASGSIANFETDLVLPIKSLEIDVNAVQSAGTPTPASPLPISGWSEISVVHCGVNIWNEQWKVGGYEPETGNYHDWNNRICSKDYIRVKPSTQYYYKSGEGITAGNVLYYDENKNYISYDGTKGNKTFTTPNNCVYINFTVGTAYGVTYNNDVGIMYPASHTSYVPYNGTTEVINLGGTYYGGHFTQDKAGHRRFDDTISDIVNLSDLVFNPTTKGGHTCFYADLPNGVIKSGGEQAFSGKCSTYTVTSNLSLPNDLSCVFYCSELYGGYTRILIRDDSASAMTGAQFTAYVTGQITYEKANPQTIALPDGEPIITLNGTNNIYADTGDCAVEYKVSVEQYVSNHSGGGGAKSLGGVYLGGSNSGSEEEPTEESEETEKTKLDEPKEEIKEIGDMKKLGGE